MRLWSRPWSRPSPYRDEDGSAAVETTLIALPLIVMVLLAVAMSRMVSARIDVDDAAQQAARAASLTRDPAVAKHAADLAATTALVGDGRACASTQVSVDTADFIPGGLAEVTVTCTTTLYDLGVPLPGTHGSTSRAAAPIDTYTFRQGTP